ncbi:unnamed protein product [Heligmosomoides polygyrus]|uniref:Uncharacterized protein n=1 Tax=Heligmosomoides polygyrus TaxID=6339 RepID=A0A183FK94_HELPZ|nr:unnamed protein product [Heligmosomoides polygyrus]
MVALSQGVSCGRRTPGTNTAGSTLFIMNLFGKRTETVQVVSRMLFYAAQALLFLANERTF